jgi:hypothetical protein
MKPIQALVACLIVSTAIPGRAETFVTVDPQAPWFGYMNVSNLPTAPVDPGVYQFGSSWGVADLCASFAGSVLTLSPNTIGDPNAYWYNGEGASPGGPGAPGNKIMAASMYVEKNDGGLSGQSVTFTGQVVANTFTGTHATVAFIRDFAPDYSSVNSATANVVDGVFSVTLNTIGGPGRHVQYGFETVGVNVWVTDVAPFGSLQVEAVDLDQYDLWMTGFDFSDYEAPNLTKEGDPDGDGQTNLEEFALDGNPASAAANERIRSRIATVGTEKALVITVPVRGYPSFSVDPGAYAVAGDLTYYIEGSNNLAAFDQTVTEVIPAITADMPSPSGNWNYRTFRLAGALDGPTPRGPAGFLRVNVGSVTP